MSLTIAPATRKDAYTLLVLTRAFFPYAAFTSAKMTKRLANPAIQYFIARDEKGTAVGFVDYALYKTHAKILAVAVLPEQRGKGIAKQLVEKALDEIKKSKKPGSASHYRRVFLMTSPDNQAALKLYEKYGFVRHASSKKRLYGNPLILLRLDF